jgi:hypothetical protein
MGAVAAALIPARQRVASVETASPIKEAAVA